MYEHKVERVQTFDEDIITKVLADATVDGWELVSTVSYTQMISGNSHGGSLYLFFKRPFLRELDPARVGG